jgi:hypothetical protein
MRCCGGTRVLERSNCICQNGCACGCAGCWCNNPANEPKDDKPVAGGKDKGKDKEKGKEKDKGKGKGKK